MRRYSPIMNYIDYQAQEEASRSVSQKRYCKNLVWLKNHIVAT